jgi:hypothetical protein
MRTEHRRFYSACAVFTVGSVLRPKKQFSQPRLVVVRCALRRNVSCESNTGACLLIVTALCQYDSCAETGFDPRPVHVVFVVKELLYIYIYIYIYIYLQV